MYGPLDLGTLRSVYRFRFCARSPVSQYYMRHFYRYIIFNDIYVCNVCQLSPHKLLEFVDCRFWENFSFQWLNIFLNRRWINSKYRLWSKKWRPALSQLQSTARNTLLEKRSALVENILSARVSGQLRSSLTTFSSKRAHIDLHAFWYIQKTRHFLRFLTPPLVFCHYFY